MYFWAREDLIVYRAETTTQHRMAKVQMEKFTSRSLQSEGKRMMKMWECNISRSINIGQSLSMETQRELQHQYALAEQLKEETIRQLYMIKQPRHVMHRACYQRILISQTLKI